MLPLNLSSIIATSHSSASNISQLPISSDFGHLLDSSGIDGDESHSGSSMIQSLDFPTNTYSHSGNNSHYRFWKANSIGEPNINLPIMLNEGGGGGDASGGVSHFGNSGLQSTNNRFPNQQIQGQATRNSIINPENTYQQPYKPNASQFKSNQYQQIQQYSQNNNQIQVQQQYTGVGFQAPGTLQRNNSEPLITSNGSNQNLNIPQPKSGKQFTMNINAQSYTPNFNRPYQDSNQPISNNYKPEQQSFIQSTSTYKVPSSTQPPQLVERQELNTSDAKNNLHFSRKKDTESQTLEQLRIELIVKEKLIKDLSEQLESFYSIKDNTLGTLNSDSLTVPNNYYQLFKNLTSTLNEKSVELEDTKQRLEALLVSISMNSNSSKLITVSGQLDEQELTHKIISKMSILQNENENLLKMISYSNKLSLLIELGLLRNENESLKQQLANSK